MNWLATAPRCVDPFEGCGEPMPTACDPGPLCAVGRRAVERQESRYRRRWRGDDLVGRERPLAQREEVPTAAALHAPDLGAVRAVTTRPRAGRVVALVWTPTRRGGAEPDRFPGMCTRRIAAHVRTFCFSPNRCQD